MAARKFFLRLSLVTVPVRMAPATSESDKIKFNMINSKTGNRVKQQLVDAENGKVVERSDIVRGYEYDSGSYVTVTDDELAAIKVDSSTVIDIEQVVDAAELPPEYLDAPYYLTPDGKMADEAYAVIRDALGKTGRIGLGRLVMSTREHAVALRADGARLSLTTLRSAEEIRQPETYLLPPAPAEMVQLAEAILAQKAGAWDPARWTDRYQAKVRELIAAKVKGMPLPAAAEIPVPRSTVVNLMDVLRRSVAQQAGKEDHAAAMKPAAKGRKKAEAPPPAKERAGRSGRRTG